MRRVHKPAIRRSETAQVGNSLPTAIQDKDLMPGERRFRDDGTKATGFYKPYDGDDQMNQKDEDVVHAGIVSKSQKIPESRVIL
jgi:hypothetical protein